MLKIIADATLGAVGCLFTLIAFGGACALAVLTGLLFLSFLAWLF